MNEIKPTAIFTPFGGRVEIRMFGKQTGDWSLKQLGTENETFFKERLSTVSHVLTDLRLVRIYAPRPKIFNAKINEVDDFYHSGATHVPSPTETTWLFTAVGEGAIVRDSSKLHEDFFPITFFYTADCAVIVIHDPKTGRTVASHAGRDSVIDRSLILTGEKSRPCFSVVDSMLQFFEDKSRVRAFICGGLSRHEHPLNTNNPEHLQYNRAICEHFQGNFPNSFKLRSGSLFISVINIIEEQLISHGVSPDNIGTDCSNTVDDNDETGEFTWWSHSRWYEEGKEGPDGRNGILVVRRW